MPKARQLKRTPPDFWKPACILRSMPIVCRHNKRPALRLISATVFQKCCRLLTSSRLVAKRTGQGKPAIAMMPLRHGCANEPHSSPSPGGNLRRVGSVEVASESTEAEISDTVFSDPSCRLVFETQICPYVCMHTCIFVCRDR